MMTRSAIIGRFVAGLAASVLLSASAFAQNPVISATYLQADPKNTFAFKWVEKGKFQKNVGTLRWGVPENQFGTSGLDRAFDTYCAEALVPIYAGKTYRFELQSPDMPEAYGLPDTDEGRKEATRRTAYVRELFGRYYTDTQKANDPTAAVAFQVAVWELMQESQVPADVQKPYDLFAGNFQADYASLEQSPAHIQRAQEYVRSLTGNDAVFAENTALAGRELVRLKGVPSVAGEVGQSQLALRLAGGSGGAGGVGNGIGTPGGTNGLLTSGGGGIGTNTPRTVIDSTGTPGFGGIGTNTGGGPPTTTSSPVPVGSPTGTTTTPPTPTNPGTGVPPIDSPPSSIPPDTPDVPHPPVGGGGNTPVPAPPAVLLGLVGLGLIVGRRVIRK